MNNIVVPLSITSPRALTIVKPKEIVTPGWKQQRPESKAAEKEREKERERERTEKDNQPPPPPPPPDDEKAEVRLLEEIEPAPLQNHVRESGVPSSSEEVRNEPVRFVPLTLHSRTLLMSCTLHGMLHTRRRSALGGRHRC
jgi:hypothetical protein